MNNNSGKNRGNSLTIVVLCVLITAFCFSTMEVALKLGGGNLDSLQLTFLRFLIGGLVMLPFGIREQSHQTPGDSGSAGKAPALKSNSASHKILGLIAPGDLPWVFLVGIVGIPISMLCFQLGVERCNAATAAAIMSLNPLITMVILHLFTDNKMTNLKKLAFILGIIAGVFLMKPWNVQPGNTGPGMFLMVAAASTFSLYTILGKKSIERVGTFTQISVSFILGSLVLLVIMLIMGRPVIAGVMDNLPLVLYLGFFVTGVGYLSLNTAVKLSDATTGSIAFFIKPVMAPIFAALILHESILWNTIIGIVFLVTASILTLYDSKR